MNAGIYFTMAGSWAVALEALGFLSTDIKWHVCVKEFKKPFQLNFQDIPFYENTERCERVDLIVGSPPCIGMSCANNRFNDAQKVAGVNHPANQITLQFAREVVRLEPKGFVMEMVGMFMRPKFESLFKEYMDTLTTKYNVTTGLIDFVQYNVPQHRKRAIIMGLRKDLNEIPVFPEPITPDEKDWQTVGDAFKGLPGFTQDEAIGMGLTRWFNPAWKGPYSTFLNPNSPFHLRFDRPSPCVAAIDASYFTHPSDRRLITWREAARLMEFPDSFKFEGGFSKCVKFASWGVPCNGITYFIAPVINAILDYDERLKAKKG